MVPLRQYQEENPQKWTEKPYKGGKGDKGGKGAKGAKGKKGDKAKNKGKGAKDAGASNWNADPQSRKEKQRQERIQAEQERWAAWMSSGK